MTKGCNVCGSTEWGLRGGNWNGSCGDCRKWEREYLSYMNSLEFIVWNRGFEAGLRMRSVFMRDAQRRGEELNKRIHAAVSLRRGNAGTLASVGYNSALDDVRAILIKGEYDSFYLEPNK